MTYNPHDPGRTSGGSSSGSAALVAAGVCRPCARHRHRRLDQDPGGLLRHRRAQADLWRRAGGRRVPAVREPATTSARSPRTCRAGGRLFAVMAGAALPGRRRSAAVRVGRAYPPDGRSRPARRRARAGAGGARGACRARLRADRGRRARSSTSPTTRFGTVVLYEAYAVHRAAARARGVTATARAPAPCSSWARRLDEHAYQGARIEMRRVAEGSSRRWRRWTCWPARPWPTRPRPRIRRSATPQGDVEARFTGPYNLAGLPAVSVPCGVVEGHLPVALQLAAGPRRRAAAAVGGDRLRGA